MGYSRPPLGHRPSHGGALGGIDPFTLLLLKDGGLGHGGGLSGLLPLLLLGGGGLGGKGKGGLGINPLLLSLLGGSLKSTPSVFSQKLLMLTEKEFADWVTKKNAKNIILMILYACHVVRVLKLLVLRKN